MIQTTDTIGEQNDHYNPRQIILGKQPPPLHSHQRSSCHALYDVLFQMESANFYSKMPIFNASNFDPAGRIRD
jgi:hypothetical protein